MKKIKKPKKSQKNIIFINFRALIGVISKRTKVSRFNLQYVCVGEFFSGLIEILSRKVELINWFANLGALPKGL
jgi:hypothetical protein